MSNDFMEIPKPYDETKDPNKFWIKDSSDAALPAQLGFTTDLVYFMRGMEVPTLFTIWSGLWLISTCVKREAWIKWYPKKMYANIYVILAGPAGCKKSTTIDDVGIPLVNKMHKYIQNHNMKKMKNINIVKDKMTPESLLFAMLPENKPGKQSFIFTGKDETTPVLDKAGKPMRYRATSETGIVLSEMASSVGKRSYTEGFVEILLDLYNARDTWDWTTMARGKKTLKNTFLSMLAATTPTGFKESVPHAAMGDGFLSRCILAYQATNHRRFSFARQVVNGPSEDELAQRLAWICENAQGEYVLSKEAFEFYDNWYHQFRDHLDQCPEEQGFRSRMNINVLKVAMLLRVSRYDNRDKVIAEKDIKDAINLITYTYARSSELLLNVASNDFQNHISKLTSMIRRFKRVSRTDLLRKSHIPANELNTILDHMVQEGTISIKNNGKEQMFPTKSGSEMYYYKGLAEEDNEDE